MMNKKKSTMMKRYQQSYETKDSGAGSKKGVMKSTFSNIMSPMEEEDE